MAISKHWTDNERKLQDQLQKIQDTVATVRTSINDNLEEQEISITGELELLEKKMAEFNQNHLNCESIIAHLSKNLETLDAAHRLGTSEQIFVLQQRFEESFEKLNVKCEHLFSELENMDMSLEMNENLDTIIKSGNLGRVKFERHYRHPMMLENIVTVDVPQDDGNNEEPLYTGMDFLPDGRLVAVDNYNGKCLIFNEALLLLKSFEVSEYPHSVVSVSEDEIAITFDGDLKIEFLCISVSNEVTHIKTVKTKSQYHSISMKDDQQFLVGLVEGTKPVRILSVSGNETDFKVHFPVKEDPKASQTCTYIQNSHKIVISHLHENVVYIIDVKTDTSIAVKDEQIKAPKGLAIGPFDIIFVCSSYTHSIVQISSNGQILSSSKLDIDYPYRICVARDKTQVAVANNVAGHRMLQLLKIDI